MTKVAILGAKNDQESVIKTLHSLKAVHIEEHKPGELDIGAPSDKAEDISSALVKAKSLLAFWNLDYTGENGLKESTHKTIQRITRIHKEVQELQEKSSEHRGVSQQIRKELHDAKVLKSLGLTPKYLSLSSVTVLVGTLENQKGLKEELEHVTSEFELKTQESQLAVATSTQHAETIQQLLVARNFKQITDTPAKSVSALKKELKESVSKRKAAEETIKELKNKHGAYVQQATCRLEEDAQMAEAPLKFASSKNLFYITGFVPSKQLLIASQQLEKAASNRLHIEILSFEKGEKIPIKLDHPKPVKSFEFFMELYNLPRYKEFDPTVFTFLTFPLLFGFMLGDIGYGITTLIMWLVLKKVFPKARGFWNILITAALWTIFWGVMFGEVFGAEILWGYDLWRVLSRLHAINELLMLSLAVGVIHLNIGLAIGFFNELKAHGLKAAIFEKVSWVVLQIAALFFYLSYGLPIFQYWVPYVILAIAMVMLYLGEGVRGLIEMPAIFSNILSYARLMAIGLASAGLAVVVNQFTLEFIAKGTWGIIPAVLIFALGHIINIGLGTLGPFLHSLRLHYVEFFSRFFKGGGRKFEPFGAKN